MQKLKTIATITIVTIAIMLFAGEAPVEMFPVQLAAGMALIAIVVINGRRNYA